MGDQPRPLKKLLWFNPMRRETSVNEFSDLELITLKAVYRALRANPDSAGAHAMLARWLLDDEIHDTARVHIDHALKLSPRSPSFCSYTSRKAQPPTMRVT